MTTTRVPDEVWNRLDPTAARLPRRTRLKVIAWTVAAVVVAFGVLVLTASGLFIHRVSITRMSGYGNGVACRWTVTIKNSGWFTEHVRGQAYDARGTGAILERGLASNIPSGGSRTILVRYPMSSCEHLAGSGGALPHLPATDLVLCLDRPWGTSTTTLVLEPPPLTEGLTIRW